MKIPEKAPGNWFQLIDADFSRGMKFLRSSEGKEFVKKANREYDHWENVKYYSLPEGITPEFAWGVLKVVRRAEKQIPLNDKNGVEFCYWLPDIVLRELSYIDKHNGEHLLSDRPDIPSQQKHTYLYSSLMEEAIASSQLEGAATTREKAKDMLRTGKEPQDQSEKMIRNNYRTIVHLKDLAKEPLSPETIKRIQVDITGDTLRNPADAGRYRSAEDRIQVIDRLDGGVLFDPPAAAEIEERIKALCAYANTVADDEFVHPVVKAIFIHFWLAYIHPFVDGNGRTARALFYWYMLKQGYTKFEYLAISQAIKEAPAQYARAYLYTEMDECDLTYFLVFNLKIIHRAIERFESYVEHKQTEMRQVMQSVGRNAELNHRQQAVLRHAITHPDARYTVKSHMAGHHIVYQTGRTDLFDLAAKGFLKKKKEGREFVFYPADDIGKKTEQ